MSVRREKIEKDEKQRMRITINVDGPYSVSGKIPLAKQVIVQDEDGISVDVKEVEKYPDQENYSLCRCGSSNNKPFCDGSHASEGFDGTEEASRKPFLDEADVIVGPGITLLDRKDLCAVAKFCHQSEGAWELARSSGDSKTKEEAIRVATSCIAGRLVAVDTVTGKAIEPELKRSIGIIEHPSEGISGPLWIKGGIPVISSDGSKYEVRNRMTLCRCGKSENKPFCDGSHRIYGFNDGDSSLL